MQTKMTAKDLKYGGIAEPRIKPTFLPLPPGAVEPRGWLRDWAVTARDGLSGHMDELSPTFRDGWKGTSTEANEDRNDGHYGNKIDGTGGILCESAYWLDGALRLGYLLHDQALIDKITKRLLPIVEGVNQGGDSFIYWRKGKPDNGFRSFSHSHLGRALVTWYRATGDKRILDALVRAYTNYPVPLGHLQFEADISGIENLDPLLEAYAFSGDQRLLDLAKTAMADPEAEATLREWGEGKFITGHGVGASEHIRLPILLYPWTGEGKYRQASVNGFQYFAQEHMLPYGVTSAEEWLAGIGAFRLTETCDVSEQLWTSSWMYRILGERVYGDGM
ncbi:MAG: hypothetical protein ACOYOU_20120, partial [Kiritimatiellia bacterium]